MRILMISEPGDDRGPGVMYRNHLKALTHPDSDMFVTSLSQEIWESDNLLKSFDVAWGYVRFHPGILPRLRSLNIPVIGGPNIAMERADAGISDEYERWYLTQSSADMNLNVAEYYRDHVAKFVKNGMKCEVLEGSYDVESISLRPRKIKDIDVLLYHKVRVNDNEENARVRHRFIENGLKRLGLTTHTVIYGSHTREEYFDLCSRSKVVAWLSIEDYASLAQIEAHLLGACVIGTPYNFTIPVFEQSVCTNSQDMKDWITWKEPDVVSRDFIETTQKILSIENLEGLVRERAASRHGFDRYRKDIKRLIEGLK